MIQGKLWTSDYFTLKNIETVTQFHLKANMPWGFHIYKTSLCLIFKETKKYFKTERGKRQRHTIILLPIVKRKIQNAQEISEEIVTGRKPFGSEVSILIPLYFDMQNNY